MSWYTVTGESIASTGSGLEACAASDKDASRSVFRPRPAYYRSGRRPRGRAPHLPMLHTRALARAVLSIYSDTLCSLIPARPTFNSPVRFGVLFVCVVVGAYAAC